LVVDQDAYLFVFVVASDADVVHAGVDAQGDGAVGVDAVFADSPVPVGSCGGGFASGCVGLFGGSSVEGSVGSGGVVVAGEVVELVLQVGDRGVGWLGAEPFLQCLLEAFDFALGLWVVGVSVFLGDAQEAEFVLEGVVAAADAGSEDESVVGEGGGGWPVSADGVPELGEDIADGDDGVCGDGEGESGVVVDEGEDLDSLPVG
jgi:hypothetical protein